MAQPDLNCKQLLKIIGKFMVALIPEIYFLIIYISSD